MKSIHKYYKKYPQLIESTSFFICHFTYRIASHTKYNFLSNCIKDKSWNHVANAPRNYYNGSVKNNVNYKVCNHRLHHRLFHLPIR